MYIGLLGITPNQDCTYFLNSWSPGAGFIPIISINGINQLSLMHTKIFNTFFKNRCKPVWVQFHVYHVYQQDTLTVVYPLTGLWTLCP